MARRLQDVIAELPREDQDAIEARFQELKVEVEGLRELRRIAGKAQAEIASILAIRQPTVSKIEKQTDMYLSTLRRYVEAMGGNLELVVTFPSRPAIHLRSLGELRAELP